MATTLEPPPPQPPPTVIRKAFPYHDIIMNAFLKVGSIKRNISLLVVGVVRLYIDTPKIHSGNETGKLPHKKYPFVIHREQLGQGEQYPNIKMEPDRIVGIKAIQYIKMNR